MCENTNYTNQIIALNSQVLTQATAIGAFEKTISVLQDQLKEAKETADNSIPEVRIITGPKSGGRICAVCGTAHARTYCPNCESSSARYVDSPVAITYKNFDDAKRTIIEKETELLKTQKEAAESAVKELTDKLAKQKKSYESNFESIQDDYMENTTAIRKEYDRNLDLYKNTITELEEKIKELQAGIITEEIEAARKQELLLLKSEVARLTDKLNRFLEMPFWKQWFYARTQRNLKVEAEAEHAINKEIIYQISTNDSDAGYRWVPSWMQDWKNVLYTVLRNFETGKVARKNRK